jgi:hypothetical protein
MTDSASDGDTLSASWEWGDTAHALRQPGQAQAAHRSCLALCRGIVADYPEDRESQRRLAVAANHVADTLLRQSPPDTEQAEPLIKESEALWLDLSQVDPGNLRWRAERAFSALAYAHLEEVRPDPVASRRWLEEALLRFEAVPPQSAENQLISKAWTLSYLAQNLAATGTEDAAALRRWDEALDVGFTELSKTPHQWSRHSQWVDFLLKSAPLRQRHQSTQEGAMALRQWLQRVGDEMAKPDASPWWPRTVASLQRRLADLLAKEDPPAAAAANRTAFRLRIAVLTGPRCPDRRFLDEITSAAKALLTGTPTEADRQLVLTEFTRVAASAALLEPSGSWRSEWAGVATYALQAIPRGQRSPWLDPVRQALYPEPPPHPWNEDEQKGLSHFQAFVDMEAKVKAEAGTATLPPPHPSR